MSDTAAISAPAEFTEIPPYGPFGELVGPIYGCIRDGMPVVGMRMDKRHANRSDKFMHGGVVATLADNCMIWGIRELAPAENRFVTTQLSVDFIGAIDTLTGDWLEARMTFVKHGRKLHFAECFLHVNERVVARASGQFMPLEA